MAILIRCECKAEAKISAKTCSSCGMEFPRKGRLYKVVLRMGGRKVTRTIGNLEAAREIEAKLKVDIAKEEHNLQKKKPAPTLAQIWKRYLPWAMENKSSWEMDVYSYQRHLEPVFGGMRMDQISQFDVEKFVHTMRTSLNRVGKPYRPATIRQQLILLSHMYNLADKWGMYRGENPCKHVRRPRVNNQITEYMADSELKRLLDVLENWPDQGAAAVVKFALYTGLRRGEIFKLEWSNVDVDRRIITLKNPKGGTDQNLPISKEAAEVIKALPKTGSLWVFPSSKTGGKRKCIRGAWVEIREAAKLPPSFRFHGLRHHFASALVSGGVDLYTVQKLLTHKDAATTQRYAHLSDNALRKAVDISGEILRPKTKTEKIVNFLRGKN